jgi:hypothetical protein
MEMCVCEIHRGQEGSEGEGKEGKGKEGRGGEGREGKKRENGKMSFLKTIKSEQDKPELPGW